MACFAEATCVGGECLVDPNASVDCPASTDPCVAALACDPATGACTVEVPADAGAPCDADDDVCTHDACDGAGACAASGDVDECVTENQNNPCWTYVCNKKTGCAKTDFVEGLSCTDNNPCTVNDACGFNDNGQETCLGSPVDVDDGNPCTDDSCDAGTIDHAPVVGAGCTATQPCQTTGVCNAEGTCDATGVCSGCVTDGDCAAEGTPCAPASCGPEGECVVADEDVVSCTEPEDPCLSAACDPASGDCVESPTGDGGTCDDGDDCTLIDTCQGGACQPGDAVDCDDGNPCTNDTCGGGACFHPLASDGTSCGDEKSCQDGVCADDTAQCLSWGGGEAAPKDIHFGPAVALLGDDVHVLGGSPSFQHLRYDAAGSSWTEGPQMPGNGVVEGAAVAIGGRIYTVGNAFDQSVRIFDPDAGDDGEWTMGAERPTDSGRAPAVGTDGAALFAFGGTNGGLLGSADSHRYSPGDNAWTDVAPMPTARGFAAYATDGNRVYVIGGRDTSSAEDILAANEAYDLSGGGWTERAPMPTPRNGAVAAVVDGRVVVAGGFTGSTVTTLVEVYHPGDDAWTSCDPMATARNGGVAAAHGGLMLVFGGGSGSGKTSMEIATPLWD